WCATAVSYDLLCHVSFIHHRISQSARIGLVFVVVDGGTTGFQINRGIIHACCILPKLCHRTNAVFARPARHLQRRRRHISASTLYPPIILDCSFTLRAVLRRGFARCRSYPGFTALRDFFILLGLALSFRLRFGCGFFIALVSPREAHLVEQV